MYVGETNRHEHESLTYSTQVGTSLKLFDLDRVAMSQHSLEQLLSNSLSHPK